MLLFTFYSLCRQPLILVIFSLYWNQIFSLLLFALGNYINDKIADSGNWNT